MIVILGIFGARALRCVRLWISEFRVSCSIERKKDFGLCIETLSVKFLHLKWLKFSRLLQKN